MTLWVFQFLLAPGGSASCVRVVGTAEPGLSCATAPASSSRSGTQASFCQWELKHWECGSFRVRVSITYWKEDQIGTREKGHGWIEKWESGGKC